MYRFLRISAPMGPEPEFPAAVFSLRLLVHPAISTELSATCRSVSARIRTPYHVLIVGPEEGARDLGRLLVEGSPFRVRVLGIVSEDECFSRLPELLSGQVIDEIIFRVDSRQLPGLEEVFLLCDEEGIRTRIAADFFPHVNSRMSLDRLGVAPMLTFSAAPQDDLRLILKRVTDVLVSLAALIVLSPFLLLIAILIRVTSPGPAIFRQVRCGLNGRRFTFYKFRSMVENAEDLKSQLSHLNEKTTAFKIPNDPRLTPLGCSLRSFQLMNCLSCSTCFAEICRWSVPAGGSRRS